MLEFQKCLDKTEPVPYATIERIIEQVRVEAGVCVRVRCVYQYGRNAVRAQAGCR